MDIQPMLLSRIVACCTRDGLTERAFGVVAVGDGRFVERLREHKGTFKLAAKAEAYLAKSEAAKAKPAVTCTRPVA